MADAAKELVHLGLILDGNRRWARDKGLPTLEGHRKGYDNLVNLAEHIFNSGVQYVSAYIFSTENWSRTKEEVSYLMDLALKMATRDVKKLNEKDVKVVFLGTKDKLSDKLIRAIEDAEELTKNNSSGTLALCFNYGGQNEIAHAVRAAQADGVDMSTITEDQIAKYLFAPGVPPVDLMMRTSGEQRLSNFMLWRIAYSELLFVDKHWPAITADDIDAAIAEFHNRQRRFGS